MGLGWTGEVLYPVPLVDRPYEFLALAAISPLLEIFNAPPIVFHLTGATGIGKRRDLGASGSACDLAVAALAYGLPALA
jgi:hypothetical protein